MYHWQAITLAPNGTLYVVAATAASTFDEVHAVSAEGQALWVYRTLDDIVGSPSVSSEGVIVVNLWRTGVVGLDPGGKELWTYRLDGWMTASPLIGDGGIIIVTTANGTVLALNPDGTPRWSRNLGMRLVSSPVLGPDDRVYICTEDRELISMGTGGEVHWMVEFATNPIVYEHGIGPWTTAPPVVGPQGNVYISFEQSLYVIDANGNALWDYQVNNLPSDKGGSYAVNYLETPAIAADGTVYVAARSGVVHVIGFDGERIRTIDTRDAIDAPAVLGANGTLIVSHNNNSVAYHPNGTVAWRYRIYDRYLDHYTYDDCSVAPCVAADGIVYVTFANTGVYALGSGGDEEDEDTSDGDGGRIDRSWLISGSIVFLLLSGFMFAAFAVMNNTPEAREEREQRRKRRTPPPPPPEPPYAYQVPPLHADPGSETVQGYIGEPWKRERR
jgi:sugar lactone lactonase YvrE